MIQPIGSNVLIQLDPMILMERGLYLAEQKSIRVCSKCHQRAEALTDAPRCPVGTDDYALDERRDVLRFRGVDYSHKIEVVTLDNVLPGARIGTVLLLGPRARRLKPGDRVAIDTYAGGEAGDLRLVREENVLARIEETA